MSNKLKLICLVFIALIHRDSNAQKLKAGFSKEEYIESINIMAHSYPNVEYNKNFDKPKNYQLIYSSPEIGLVNQWTLWSNNDDRIIINIRGTTQKPESWLENFYAAMVPAQGSIQLDKDFNFKYKLSKHEKAGVHIGWLVGTAYLQRDILPKIDSAYKKGVKNVLIIGHSQGGGIAYLLTAYLHYKQLDNEMPADIQFKTYCSAAPKPGNLYFAYDYESYTQDGWAYNVVNTKDWVPEVPLSIQTVNDFNTTNPFTDAKHVISKQKFAARIAAKHIYNQLDKPSRKAQKKYKRYLGHLASSFVKSTLPNYVEPTYLNSSNYTRCGNYISLWPDDNYAKIFPDSKTEIFVHHMHMPYLYLSKNISSYYSNDNNKNIIGEWSVVNLQNNNLKQPLENTLIKINEKGISGTVACNSFSYSCILSDDSIKNRKAIASTMMMCEESKMKIDQAFFKELEIVNKYKQFNNLLYFYKDEDLKIVLKRN